MKKQNEGKWEQVVYEDLTKFSKEQLIEIIVMCHRANKYYLKENEILKDNSYHNDKVVDKVNWENRLLKNKIDKAIEILQDYDLVENKDKVISDTFKALRGEDND